ncbi:MAG TPA: PQQ-dependent sugar dehydrogenase [Chthoniobacteraceae bacterium]|nr:PQQ-dependent sugar dehydrogenase [Chthoniobacteraceae bacterium]
MSSRILPALLAASVTTSSLLSAEAPLDYRFKVETLAEGMAQPMEMEMAPDGRIFFNEIGGKLRIFQPATRVVADAGNIKVTTAQESGFLGFALDPKYAENGWIYCLYSPPDYDGGRLSRFTMRGDILDLASEVKILEYPEQRRECCHHAGTVEFGPDGCLYFSTGDNTMPHGDSNGYGPIDERPDMFPRDAQKSASNTNDLRGKINRIRVKPDGTYEIPTGNLFSPGTAKTRPEIYVMGCRNPWRFSIDEKTGILYYGDVGPDAGDDSNRGSRGYDELNQVRKAGFFGWPYFIGANFQYNDYDFAAKKIGEKFDPQHPFNDSPNSTGLRDLPPAQPAWIYWPYRKPEKFTELGEGGRTACAGPVFHWRPEFDKTDGFPQHFDNCLLFWDWQRPFMKWARLDADSNLAKIDDFTNAVRPLSDKEDASVAGDAFVLRRPVDAQFGKDGCLYLMDYGLTWGSNKDAKLLKISYIRGNLAPIARASAKNASGREPLTVELISEGSRDLEGDALKYEWSLNGNVLANEPTAKVILKELGAYRVDLRVTDTKGASATAFVPVNVGNSQPNVDFTSPRDGDFFTPGKPIIFSIAARDLEDGNSTAKPEEFSFRTLVSANWRRYDGKAGDADPGFTRMKQSDCFNCHAVEQPLVGPPLINIAEKYRGQGGALDAAVKRVLHGSVGVWGQVPMLPHPQHTEDELNIMMRWIFALDAKKGTPGLTRGLTGEISAPKSDQFAACVLEATYTDSGRAPAASLSGKATVSLRSRRIEADQAAEISGPQKLSSGGCTNNQCLGAVNHGHSVKFSAIHLADVGGIKVRASSGNVGGKIEFHSGSPTGPLLGSVEVPNTGGWDKWIEPQFALSANDVKDRADVVAIFTNPGKGGLMNLDWVEFLAK